MSTDSGLGQPYNIAFYALLTHMLAQVTSHAVNEFIHVHGDKHIYVNHIDKLEGMLKREIIENKTTIVLNKSIKDIFDFTADDIQLQNYNYHPAISLEVAV